MLTNENTNLTESIKYIANRLWGCRHMNEDDFRFEAESSIEGILSKIQNDKEAND